ncbi:MAG: hypothetical protein QF790_07205 [Gammaproteobacteria bacterium]|jgi:hypothetical protein|nr:hypothetical protein [Gammaproteobacteria bacterium]MDP6616932.1 hypothetical protein [Gammaproteobacteria bacterium]MDP6696044.1 hypothetical protein [Gammaproteobacteria bacterium]MDP7041174.1 hypothetical protein [Gammaproteobacteria bacterium]
MRFLKRFLIVIVVLAICFILLDRCAGLPNPEYTTVTVNGDVKMIAGPVPAGTIHFRLYVLESLEGVLQHPLEEIEDFESDSATFSHTFEYPLHMGTGLAVHAWVDADGDNIFCTPSARLDPSGLASDTETPSGEVQLDITLTENCRAANWFYPPAP